MQTKEHRITLRVSSDLRRRIKREAKRTGSAEAEVIRSAVENQLPGKRKKQSRDDDQGPSAYDLLMADGLIGCVKGERPDLSTNKKYFDGFGKS
jgi:predicted DNA-binding protein